MKRTLLSLIAPSLLAGIASAADVWVYNSTTGMSSGYTMIPWQTYPSAQATAAAMGGTLVTINNKIENYFIANYYGAGNYGNLWIGINDRVSEGNFVWDSGQTPGFTNWDAGEPNNANAGEDNTEMYGNGNWNDVRDGLVHMGVVEQTVPGIRPTSYRGHTYVIVNPSGNGVYTRDGWLDSQSAAIALGGNLITINDAAEQAFAQSLVSFNVPAHRGADAWIGLNDYATEGTFVWADGTPVGYTNWNSGDPNDFYFGNPGEDAVHLDGDGRWQDQNPVRHNVPWVGIVEIVPEPTTATLVLLAALGLLARRRRD